MTKTCTVCHLIKDISHFGHNKCSKDGYHYVCKECHNKKNKEFKQQNKNKIRKVGQNYYQAHKQQEQCFHYSNLQPLWWRENLSKKDKYE